MAATHALRPLVVTDYKGNQALNGMCSRMRLVSPGSWSLKLKNVTLSPSLLPYKVSNVCPKEYPSAFIHCRWKSVRGVRDSSLSRHRGNRIIAKIAKETTDDYVYFVSIIAGISVAGVSFYYILRELFSSQSPNPIYSDALQLCRSNATVIDTLGEPIKGYRVLSFRGRRRLVSPLEYEKDGKKYLVMMFNVKGSKKSGTVCLEMVEVEKSKYEYTKLFVDVVDGYPQRITLKNDFNFYSYILSLFKFLT